MSAILDNILLDFTHADDDIIKRFSHEKSFLRMHHLIKGILKVSINLKVSQVKSSVILEPFIIISFEVDLNYESLTPFSLRFSSRG